jgi:N-acetylmuramoyl-L-alanine amidase
MRMFSIDYNTYRSIKGFNRRTRFLVLHYTAVNFKGAIAALTGPSMSSHYLVPDPTDPTYTAAGFKDLRIFNLVDERERAWHAGVSAWARRSNLNDTAIGVEIVYLATEDKGVFTFPSYNPLQIQAVKALAANIIQRYPDITPVNIVGHSDIAIGRKSDPGAAFPWKELHDAGIGAWYDEATRQRYQQQFSSGLPDKADVVSKLSEYGYDPRPASTDAGYKNLIRAFQLHFRPQKYDGVLDAETAAILYSLLEKYFPAKTA